jgi:phage-related protein
VAGVVSFVVEARDRASEVMARIAGGVEKFAAQAEEANASIAASAKAAADAMMTAAEKVEASEARATAAARTYSKAMTEQVAAMQEVQAAAAQVAAAERLTADAEQMAADAAKLSGSEQAEAMTKAEAAAKAAADATLAAAEREAEALNRVRDAERAVAVQAADMETASARAAEAATAQSQAAGTSSRSLRGMGVAAAAVAVGVGLMGGASVRAAATFQTSMTRLVTSAGESQDAIKKVSAGVLQLAVDTGTSTDELAKGLYMVESAGYHGAAGLTVLRAAAQGARAEGASLDEVSNALTSAMNAYGYSAKDATKVTDMMVAAVGTGKMKMQDLASSLSAVLPVAAAAHISFQEISGAIATMTAQGMSAQQATQDLSHIIQRLQSPTADSAKYMAQLGLNAQDLSAHLGERGLTGTLQLVYNAIAAHMGPAGQVVVSAFNKSHAAAEGLQAMLKSMPPSLAQLGQAYLNGSVTVKEMTKDIQGMSGPQATLMKQFVALAGNAQGFNQMLKAGNPAALQFSAALKKVLGDSTSLNTALLIGGDHMATFKGNVATIGEAAQQAGKDVNGWAEIQGTFNFKLSQLKESLKTVEIAIGSGLLPVVSSLTQHIVAVVKPIAEWMAAHQTLSAVIVGSIGGLGALIATAVGVAMAIKKVKESVEILKTAIKGLSTAGPWMIALTALVTVAILIATHWRQTKAILSDVFGWLKNAAGDVAGFFVRVWQGAVHIWDEIWGAIGGTVKKWWPLILAPVTGGMSVIVGIIIKYRTQIAKAFEDIWSGLVSLWNATGGKLISLIGHAWSVVSASASQEWRRISADLSQIWGSLVGIWNATGGKLVSLISGHWNQIETIAKTVWGAIWSAIKQELDFIYAGISYAFHVAADVVNVAWAAISGATRIAWNLIWGILKGTWDLITGIIKAALDFIYGTLIKPAFETIKTFFEVIWDGIKGVINTALDFIKGILRVFLDLVTGQWSKAWNDIQDLIKTVTRDIWTTIETVFWRWLVSIMRSITDGILSAWNAIWNGIKGFLKSIWDGILGAFRAGLSTLHDVWDGLKKLAADPVNFIIQTVYDDGIVRLWNDVSGVFGGPKLKPIGPISFADGGPVRGPGTGTSDSILARVSNGEFIVNAEATRRNLDLLYAINNGYAAGGLVKSYRHGGFIDTLKSIGGAITGGLSAAWNAVKHVALGGLADAARPIVHGIESLADHLLGTTGFGGVLDTGIHKLGDDLLTFLTGKDKTAFTATPVNVSGSVVSWIQQAMSATGVSGPDWLNGLEIIVKYESGGNPNAINNWDSNAQAGDPSRGLAQVIGSTFQAYHQPGTSGNIYDPVANLAAAINYIRARYGSIDNVPGVRSVRGGGGYVGYDSGGILPPGLTMAYNGTGRNEYVLTAPQAAHLGTGGPGTTVVINVTDNQLLSTNAMIEFVQQFERFFVQTALPQAGVHIRYQA